MDGQKLQYHHKTHVCWFQYQIIAEYLVTVCTAQVTWNPMFSLPIWATSVCRHKSDTGRIFSNAMSTSIDNSAQVEVTACLHLALYFIFLVVGLLSFLLPEI